MPLTFTDVIFTSHPVTFYLIHVCMFRENRRAKVVAAFYSLSHISRHPLGVWLKLAIRQNTEHSRLEHFIVSKTLGKGWCGEVGEDHPFFPLLNS